MCVLVVCVESVSGVSLRRGGIQGSGLGTGPEASPGCECCSCATAVAAIKTDGLLTSYQPEMQVAVVTVED